MAGSELSGNYADGEAYERFMGRWSRASGREFVRWLDPSQGLLWLDVGCGTGAFPEVILDA
jgi:ubiquinone/menaquinone biosynthesis C-methylase UbiE